MLYGGFAVLVLALLAVDLFVVHRETHAVSVKEAGVWSVIWIGCAVAFGLAVPRLHQGHGGRATVEYFTSYVIEKSLSIDATRSRPVRWPPRASAPSGSIAAPSRTSGDARRPASGTPTRVTSTASSRSSARSAGASRRSG